VFISLRHSFIFRHPDVSGYDFHLISSLAQALIVNFCNSKIISVLGFQ